MMRSVGSRKGSSVSYLDALAGRHEEPEHAPATPLPTTPLPTLLATPTFRVKNTFIQSVVEDVQADDSDEEELPPMVATRSAPVVSFHSNSLWKPSDYIIQSLTECTAEGYGNVCDDSEDDDADPALPMMVTRTFSNFSTYSAGQAVSHEASFEDYAFDASPMVGLGVEDYDDNFATCIDGIGSTFLRRVRGGVSVRNTFIDDYLDGDEEDEAPAVMVPTRSCPTPTVFETATLPAQDLAFNVPFVQPWAPASSPWSLQQPQQPPSKPPGIFVQGLARDDPSCRHCSEPRQTSSESEAVSETIAEPLKLPAGVTPLVIRQPEKSAGSAGHDAGECRPCAWFWRTAGCLNGESCRHCHLCPQGAMKARRKVKRSAAAQAISDEANGTV